MARAKRLRRSCRKHFVEGMEEQHLTVVKARSTRVTSQIVWLRRDAIENLNGTIRWSLEKRQAVEESFHDSPMDRCSASSRRRKSFTVSPGYRHMGAQQFTSLRSKQKSCLTAMRLLPKQYSQVPPLPDQMVK